MTGRGAAFLHIPSVGPVHLLQAPMRYERADGHEVEVRPLERSVVLHGIEYLHDSHHALLR